MCDHRIGINDMARASLNIQKNTKDLKIYNKSHKTNEQKQKVKQNKEVKSISTKRKGNREEIKKKKNLLYKLPSKVSMCYS